VARAALAVEEERRAEVLVHVDLQPVGALQPDDVLQHVRRVQAAPPAVAQEPSRDLLGGVALPVVWLRR